MKGTSIKQNGCVQKWDGDIGTRVWGLEDLGTRDEGLEDIKYGTRGCRDIKYRYAGDAGCE